MKTDELIDLLAQGAGAAPRAQAPRRLLPGAALGLLASVALAWGLLGLIPARLYHELAPWFKLIYAGALALAAGWLVVRLSRPVPRWRAPLAAVAAVLGAGALVGVLGWLASPPATRMAGLMGHSWSSCSFNVLALSLPGLAAAFWALRGLAPTQPRAAGAAAGLLAGSLGAWGYALSCTELALPFVALWYTLGVLLSAALGAVLGPRGLRW